MNIIEWHENLCGGIIYEVHHKHKSAYALLKLQDVLIHVHTLLSLKRTCSPKTRDENWGRLRKITIDGIIQFKTLRNKWDAFNKARNIWFTGKF